MPNSGKHVIVRVGDIVTEDRFDLAGEECIVTGVEEVGAFSPKPIKITAITIQSKRIIKLIRGVNDFMEVVQA